LYERFRHIIKNLNLKLILLEEELKKREVL